ncbi:MAG TPA: right-handed parallel beta-helix repeat-containing protein [Planctomycetota bacterium]|nr:right-handed parallel beta-helix repeat-containing protein [Planctomycetota bacterium]
MKMLLVIAWLSCLLSRICGAEYHLSALGDDVRDGLTPETAWRTLVRANVGRYQPGDRLVLRAGDRFIGSLRLDQGGDAHRPLVITSSAGGRATIVAGSGETGVMIDAGHITLRGIDVTGPGATAAPAGDGIHLRCAVVGRRVAGVMLSDLRVSGFPGHGIRLSAEVADAGVDDLLVERCRASANGEGGMGSWGPCTQGVWSHHRIVVRDSLFHDNRGLPTKDTNHCGNGIILGDVQDAVIERCSAWGNGADCTFTGGGPVGIWLCEADRSVIRACVSHHNRTGMRSVDGGGFDLDGGCTRCVIEGCLSWRNDGAGYLLCQYQGARELRGNQIRDCWSVDNKHTHGYTALHL